MAREQQKALAARIPATFITDNGRGMDAMDQSVTTQYLIGILGTYNFDHVETLRSTTKKGDEQVVTGVIMRLSGAIDGQPFSITEAGGVENADNDDGDGERMKKAMSDALKRCAMRIGLGLHIWADTPKEKHYFLDKILSRGDEPRNEPRKPEDPPQQPEKPASTPPPEQPAKAPSQPQGKPEGKVATKSSRMKLAHYIGKSDTRNIEDFEKEAGLIHEMSQEECDGWIELLEHEQGVTK